MSSFTVSATAVTFVANQDNFSERRQSLLRTWEFEVFLALAADYTTLASLFSYPVTVRAAPGPAGATMFVDVGGGAGAGSLVLDNVVGSPFNAALVDISRPSAYPGGGRRCRVTFQEAPV